MRAKHSQRPRRKAFGFRPQVEVLEERNCPSFSFGIQGHTLLLTGDQADNMVQIRNVGREELSVVTDTAAAKKFAGIDKVVVRLGDGSNTLDAKLAAGIALSVDAGRGDNTFRVHVAQDERLTGHEQNGEIIAIHTGGSGLVALKLEDVPDVSLKLDTGAGAEAVELKLDGFSDVDLKMHSSAGGETVALKLEGGPDATLMMHTVVAAAADGRTPGPDDIRVTVELLPAVLPAAEITASVSIHPGGNDTVALKLEGRIDAPMKVHTGGDTIRIDLEQEFFVTGSKEEHVAIVLAFNDGTDTIEAKIDYKRDGGVALRVGLGDEGGLTEVVVYDAFHSSAGRSESVAFGAPGWMSLHGTGIDSIPVLADQSAVEIGVDSGTRFDFLDVRGKKARDETRMLAFQGSFAGHALDALPTGNPNVAFEAILFGPFGEHH